MKKHPWERSALFLYATIFTLLCVASCRRFYMPVKNQVNNTREADSLVMTASQGRYLILRADGRYYHMKSPVLDEAREMLSFSLERVSGDHLKYLEAKKRKYHYKKSDKAVLNETHVYVSNSFLLGNGDSAVQQSIPLTAIEKIEFIEHDKNRTTTSYILGGLAITGAVILTAGVIVFLSSCPYVSVSDGDGFKPQGELFGGAVSPSLERRDYLPMNAIPRTGGFSVKIHNELKEVQHVNYAHLRVIEHNSGERALVSQDGEIFVVGSVEKPLSARLNEAGDAMKSLAEKDMTYFTFNDTASVDGVNQLRIRFPRPAGATDAKLVLSARGTLWFEYLYGSFTAAFGTTYASWVSSRQTAPAAKVYQWMESQHIPLQVSVDASGKTKSVSQIHPIGPLMSRDFFVPIELPASDAGYVDVILTTGFMFWEIDYAGISFGKSSDYQETVLKPARAVDESGVDRLRLVMEKDSMYVVQPLPGNALFLEYAWNRQVPEGRSLSLVLEGSGHYQPIRDYAGAPKTEWLNTFRSPGRFPQFSREKYLEYKKNSEPAFIQK
jgi:hypothetical protein